MIAEEQNGMLLLRFPMLSKSAGLRHAVFTRKGGSSRGPFAGLNVGRGVGDEADAVEKNRERICRAMGGAAPVYLRQRHGAEVAVVGDGEPAAESTGAAEPATADAAVTDRPDRLLVIQVADCQAVIVHDPVRQVLANIHSGWRGSVADIIGGTVRTMVETFGCRPENLSAGIGPSLGPCCAEFAHYRTEIPEALWGYRVGDCHFDFWAMSVDQLEAAGVARRRVEVAGICSRCRTDLFYSYRGEKTTGRFAVVAGLQRQGESP